MESNLTQITPTTQADVPESFATLAELLDKYQRLTDAAELLPQQITLARESAETAHQSMLEADMSAISDFDTQDVGNGTGGGRADELMHEALEAGAVVRRLEARLPALESRIDEFTSEVQTEIQIAKGDAAAVIGEMVAALGPDLLAALEPLKLITARIIALEECLPSGITGRSRFQPFIPEPGHEALYVGGGDYSKGPNLLTVDDATMTAARAAVANEVQCVRDVLALARSFSTYVPHKERPKPYVLKGVSLEYSGAPPVPESEIIKR